MGEWYRPPDGREWEDEGQGEGRLYALDVIRSWPTESRQSASWVIHVHHEPGIVTPTELVWEEIPPWHRIVATQHFEERDWPVHHTASIRSEIRYEVPADVVRAIEETGLPIEIDHAAGMVTTVGPDLRTNLLTFNLMHDVVTGKADPQEAARRYAAATTAQPGSERPEGRPDDMVKCRFDDAPPLEPSPVPPSDQVPGGPHEPGVSTAGVG